MLIKSIVVSLFLLAHSWYPRECCSDRDCSPVPCSELQEGKDGSVVYQGIVFSKDKVKPSLDNQCHVCMSATNFPYCVFIQTNS